MNSLATVVFLRIFPRWHLSVQGVATSSRSTVGPWDPTLGLGPSELPNGKRKSETKVSRSCASRKCGSVDDCRGVGAADCGPGCTSIFQWVGFRRGWEAGEFFMVSDRGRRRRRIHGVRSLDQALAPRVKGPPDEQCRTRPPGVSHKPDGQRRFSDQFRGGHRMD